ncbi:hypothetical protein [Streptomyces sp. NRRL B-24484]|uniref:hypothetical protein n=1 Tax=Streptomyces sp. NRRL B-24484 TaxID=1463833 RepID=UPI0004C1AD43|nr:hypothetical protein [Streptomyces sp. NRRL B-24484]
MLSTPAVAVLLLLWAAHLATITLHRRAYIDGRADTREEPGEAYGTAILAATLASTAVGGLLLAWSDVSGVWALAHVLAAVGVTALYAVATLPRR